MRGVRCGAGRGRVAGAARGWGSLGPQVLSSSHAGAADPGFPLVDGSEFWVNQWVNFRDRVEVVLWGVSGEVVDGVEGVVLGWGDGPFFLGNETSHFRQRIFGWKSVEGLGVGEVGCSTRGGTGVEQGWNGGVGGKIATGEWWGFTGKIATRVPVVPRLFQFCSRDNCGFRVDFWRF